METDVRINNVNLYFLPVKTRMPLKFGSETLTEVVCGRARVEVTSKTGKQAAGWGETPLSVQWVWPSTLPYTLRLERLMEFTRLLAAAWQNLEESGHPMELGWEFQEQILTVLLTRFNRDHSDDGEHLPWLAALVCCSLFDSALHDAFGIIHNIPTYATYNRQFMNRDLSSYLGEDFSGLYPEDFFDAPASGTALTAWHLVGGKDPVSKDERTGNEPDDGYPVLLEEWIRSDDLTCLKVKLTGTDPDWDIDRLRKIERVGEELGTVWLTADFNCQVTDPAYVTKILDILRDQDPRLYQKILYVEQPFPYDLEEHPIDVHSVSARKPLFLDESAHDWRMVKRGRKLGWTGVALKTCKTQTGALLSLCWAKKHGMTVMVQDLTNPMLAQIPHLLLAWHAGTIMGVETNSMQFYPEASAPEAAVHPGCYTRSAGRVDLQSILGRPGFGLRVEEINRQLPEQENLDG